MLASKEIVGSSGLQVIITRTFPSVKAVKAHKPGDEPDGRKDDGAASIGARSSLSEKVLHSQPRIQDLLLSQGRPNDLDTYRRTVNQAVGYGN